jgi:hypothetical protein
MAQESDLSKTADKGKGKAVEDETQKDKASQPVANGKKDEEKDECLFPPLHLRRLPWFRPGWRCADNCE